jgi:type I restriction enzyme S subunit
MNPERLLQHFDRISEAPDAVAHLRRFILDLAVRGKLVEQDPKTSGGTCKVSQRQGYERGFLNGASLQTLRHLRNSSSGCGAPAMFAFTKL